ncbi:MAG TPA: hypothetical protein PLV31_00735 [Gammaproteobacteria bacterium]|nr:hypothetical protein [Gammaproteobacteria bacterium]
MRQIEQELVSALKNFQFENGENFCKQLEEEALGQFSPDFLNVLEEHQSSRKTDFRAFSVSFSFRVCIEHYFLEKDTELKKELFSKIANNLTKIKEELSEAHGQSLFPEEFISLALIRNVYLSKDQELINLFKENLPKPRIQLFEEYALSDEIKNEAEQTVNALQIFLQDRKLPLVEFASIKTQRQLRAKKRQREEIARLAEQPQFLELKGKAEQELRIKGALREANRPYIPKSPWKLLNKNIFVTASTIELFSTVHHLTSESGLVDIFDDALYGHRTLQKLFKRFKCAALSPFDLMLGGDADVICCGPFEIDPRAKQQDFVDIVFDLDKLKGNRCAFYKQLDLCYKKKKIRSIEIGNRTLYFSHTYPRQVRFGYVDLIIFEDGFPVATSRLPNHTFISYNILQMHQILTLNFFRFLDNFKKLDGPIDLENLYMDGSPDEKRINSIYADINKLNPIELRQFLIELGQNMSDTAEFNIYGAYKIDFAAIKSITIRDKTLDFVQFVTELQSGQIEKLNATIQDLPTLFKSYRLLNYLLSKVQEAGAGNTAIQEKLLELKQSCSVPLLFRKMDCQKVNIKTESSIKTLQRKPAPLPCSHAFL